MNTFNNYCFFLLLMASRTLSTPVPIVTICVVTYQGEPWIQKCLTSLKQQTYPQEKYSIIVVDNASQDKTISLIKEEFPTVMLIKNTKNKGFGAANNQAMEYAFQHLQPAYVILINQDSWVEKTWLKELVATMEKHPEAGCCGVAQHPYEKTAVYNNAFLNDTRVASWMGCGCIILRTKALQQSGLFDELFFLYGEDIDLSWRLSLVGWKIMINRRIVWHHAGGNRKIAFGDFRLFYSWRNRLVLLLKYGSCQQIIKSLLTYITLFFPKKKVTTREELSSREKVAAQEENVHFSRKFLYKCKKYPAQFEFALHIMASVLCNLPAIIKRRIGIRRKPLFQKNINQLDKWIQEIDQQH